MSALGLHFKTRECFEVAKLKLDYAQPEKIPVGSGGNNQSRTMRLSGKELIIIKRFDSSVAG
jgi:hypothetical protein